MIVLTENPVTLNGVDIDYPMKYLSLDGDEGKGDEEKQAKKKKRKDTWQQIKDSGIGQAILDFGKDKLDEQGGGYAGGDIDPIPGNKDSLPPIITTPTKEGWWAKKSNGAKAAIILVSVAGLAVGGYFISKKLKKK